MLSVVLLSINQDQSTNRSGGAEQRAQFVGICRRCLTHIVFAHVCRGSSVAWLSASEQREQRTIAVSSSGDDFVGEKWFEHNAQHRLRVGGAGQAEDGDLLGSPQEEIQRVERP